ncbi:hypothetical protein WDU94_015574 [Cyamophila willieti]
MQKRRAFGKTWGLKPEMVKWIYTIIVRPVITYGILVWWPKVEQVTVKKILHRTQRQACLGITGAMNTTPTHALDAILDLPPLDIFMKGMARMASYRLECNNTWNPRTILVGHTKINSIIKDETLQMIKDHMPIKHRFTDPVETYIQIREHWQPDRNLKDGDIIWYTDGSKTRYGSGAGIFGMSPNKHIKVSLGRHATVFQAEVTAILIATQTSIEMRLCEKNIFIFSDSQAAIKVPGHTGIEGNEKADELAREASETTFIGPEPALAIPNSTAKRAVGEWIQNSHKQFWHNQTGLRHSKKLILEPSKQTAQKLVNLNRRNISKIVVGLLTGHCHLRKHLNTIGVHDGPITCRRCGEGDETASHALFECPAMALKRFQTLGYPGQEIENIHSDPVTSLLNFIKETAILDMEE